MDFKIPNCVNIIEPQILSFGNKEAIKEIWENLYKISDPKIKEFHNYEFYDKIIEWLADDKGLGLGIYRSEGDGLINNGSGKSIFINKVYPILLYNVYNRTPILINSIDIKSMEQLENKIFKFTNREILIIDEFSREPLVINEYGTIYKPMERIIDHCERFGWKLIFATNYTKKEIVAHYNSNHLTDRIRSLTYSIECSGKSSRKSTNKIYDR
ncbi:MAG: hypothetical protein ACOVSR_08880 [Bacteroidia bacterium]